MASFVGHDPYLIDKGGLLVKNAYDREIYGEDVKRIKRHMEY
jgi:hypothetical protein